MPTDRPHPVLRPGAPSDARELARVHLAARRAAPMPASVHPDASVEPWLVERMAEDEVWVVELDDGIAAYLRLTDTWLDDLYVAPAHARAGLGTALLDVAKARRPGGFCLWVFETNTPARAFYARHGLVELERTDGSANDEHAPDLRLAWPGADPQAFFAELMTDVEAQLGDLLARREALARAVRRLHGA